jgi:magnesium transporter
MIRVESVQITETLEFAPLAPEKVAQTCGNPDARVWLDVQDAESHEIEVWMDRLGISELSSRLCREARDRPGFYPLNREILFVIPVFAGAGIPYDVDHFAFLCRENLLVTIHRKSILNRQRTDELQESASWLSEQSIAALVSAVLIDESLECLRRVGDIRQSIVGLEERMDHDPDSIEADEILDARSRVMTLGAVIGDQLPCLQALSTTDRPFFRRRDSQEYLNCALTNLQACDRGTDRLGERIGVLRSGFDMHAQDRTNRRLGILTILSAIFMPITLLAGIWGMNFEQMPELGFSYSYPVALGVMALIGCGLYLGFRRRGWFD